MTQPPDHRPDIAIGLANLFSVMDRLQEAERQDRKAREDAKLAKAEKHGGLWWQDREPSNPPD